MGRTTKEKNSNSHIRFLIRAKHTNTTIRFGREYIHQTITVSMKSDRTGRFQQLPVDSTQDPHDVVTPRRTPHNGRILINRLQELPNDERDGLDSLHFFLGAEELSFEVRLLVFDVGFLERQEGEVLLESLETEVEIIVGRRWRCRRDLGKRRRWEGRGGRNRRLKKGGTVVSSCEKQLLIISYC